VTPTHAHPAPLAAPRLPRGLTYARARLWLGITGVGGVVVLAAAALAWDLPGRLLATDPAQPPAAAVAQVIAALLVPTVLLLPLDVLGGAVVVRDRPGAGVLVARWARGVLAQLLVWSLAAGALLGAARAGGHVGGRAGAVAATLAAFALAQLALLGARPALARLVAPLRVAPPGAALADAARTAGLDPARLRMVDAADQGFTGGWSGAAPRALWVPAHWATLPRATLVGQLARRRAVAAAGLHTRGVLGALAWNVLGMAAVLALAPAADPATAAGLATTVAWMTLWSFLGALVLPTPSRAAVYAADAAAARQVGTSSVRDAVTALDRWQDDEAERAAVIETVFHPVPSRARRLARLAGPAAADAAPGPAADVPRYAAHQVARHALYLAWGALSPLARAVHCNVGRPALWVVWPGD
jgi:hypothetical protein